MNCSPLSPLTRTTSMLLIGLLLTACATAQQAPAQQAPAQQAAAATPAASGPQWKPEQVAPHQLPKMTTPQQMQVRDRSNARWKILMAGEYAKAYPFATPKLRKDVTEETYVGQFAKKPQWHEGTEVVGVTCATATSCVARVRVELKMVLPRTNLNKITTHIDEKWLLEDGQWWLSDDMVQ